MALLRLFVSTVAVVLGLGLSAGVAPAQLNIVINPAAGLAGNQPAINAFNRAATAWSTRITNPVTINILGDMANLGGNAIGSTSLTLSGTSFNNARNAMAARSGMPGLSVLASLPTSAQFTAATPSGTLTNPANMLYTQANGKILGLPTAGLTNDAGITFNTQFNFDFDRSDGLTPGTVDFETVAIHEIGHALGFTSVVDVGNNNPRTIDMFRFNMSTAPVTAADFTNFSREYRPGQEAVLADLTNSYRMSTGTGMGGDGNQASHWKADEITGVHIGVMDPSLANAVQFDPSEADFRALELLGYNVTPVPEPAAVLGLAAAGLAAIRRRRKIENAPALAA